MAAAATRGAARVRPLWRHRGRAPSRPSRLARFRFLSRRALGQDGTAQHAAVPVTGDDPSGPSRHARGLARYDEGAFGEIETKYIFGFTEGSSIGLEGEKEFSAETVG